MSDFQNSLISRIFAFIPSDFLRRTTVMFLYNGFSHVFGIFNFLPKLTIFAKSIAFAWAIAFARLPIVKILPFLECLLFF